MIDIDNLKATNDRRGYDAGDLLLRSFAGFMEDRLRVSDIFGRYRQGDEFWILTPNTLGPQAESFTERLRAEIERHTFPAPDTGGPAFAITFSAGLASFDPSTDSEATLQLHAEEALAQAKQTKNKVKRFGAEGLG